MQPNPLPKPAQQLGPQAKSWPLKDTPSTAVKGIWVTPEHNSGNDQDPPQSRGKCDSEDNLYGEVHSTAPLLPAPLQPAGPHLCTWVLTRPSGSVRLRRRADPGCLSVAGGTRGTGGADRVGDGGSLHWVSLTRRRPGRSRHPACLCGCNCEPPWQHQRPCLSCTQDRGLVPASQQTHSLSPGPSLQGEGATDPTEGVRSARPWQPILGTVLSLTASLWTLVASTRATGGLECVLWTNPE